MLDSLKQLFAIRLSLLAEQVNPLQRSKGLTATNVPVGNRTIIETHRDKIRTIRRPQAKLLNCKQKLISLM